MGLGVKMAFKGLRLDEMKARKGSVDGERGPQTLKVKDKEEPTQETDQEQPKRRQQTS